MSDVLMYDRASLATFPGNHVDVRTEGDVRTNGGRPNMSYARIPLVRSPEPRTVLNSLVSACTTLLAGRATVSLIEQPAATAAASATRARDGVVLVPLADLPDERPAWLRVQYVVGAAPVEVDAVMINLLVGHATEILRAESLRAELAAERERSANLTTALSTNREIGAALGILMAGRRCTLDAAFDLLRAVSQTTHRKLRDIAADVILTGTLEEPEQRPRPRERQPQFPVMDTDGRRRSTG